MDLELELYFLHEENATKDGIQSICKIINDAYKKGEAGMWKARAKRISIENLEEIIKKNQLIVAAHKNSIIGTVAVKRMNDGITGEFGMLAVDDKYKNKGVGRKLIEKAEEWAISIGLHNMRLELLTPTNWEHPTKEFLKKWYYKLGYTPQEKESFKTLFPESASLLKTDCDFTVWTKTLNER